MTIHAYGYDEVTDECLRLILRDDEYGDADIDVDVVGRPEPTLRLVMALLDQAGAGLAEQNDIEARIANILGVSASSDETQAPSAAQPVGPTADSSKKGGTDAPPPDSSRGTKSGAPGPGGGDSETSEAAAGTESQSGPAAATPENSP